MSTVLEQAVVFRSAEATLVGVMHPTPEACSWGVVVVVGGPQYRVGSHRQFVLLARFLADHGIPTLRFDYQGMGDSDGEPRDFRRTGEDIRAAITIACQQLQLTGVVLWGLCDAASAVLLNAVDDPRVRGLVLLNPWVRTEAGLARAYVQQYYLKRVFSMQVWRDLWAGKLHLGRALGSLLQQLHRSRKTITHDDDLPTQMAQGLARFNGPVLIILSGEDLTAQEFRQLLDTSPTWQTLVADARVKVHTLAEANHTFSRAVWRDQVARWTLDWLTSEVSP